MYQLYLTDRSSRSLTDTGRDVRFTLSHIDLSNSGVIWIDTTLDEFKIV